MPSRASPKPTTISLIRGYCIGGGCELSMATDIRIAASGGRFAIPVAKLNILIGYKEMRRLVRLVGPGHANYILMSGRQIDAGEAARIGLVDRVLPEDEIDEYVYGLAREMVPLAPLSQRRHKEIMQTVLENPGLQDLDPRAAGPPVRQLRQRRLHRGPPRLPRTPSAPLPGAVVPLPYDLVTYSRHPHPSPLPRRERG